MERPSELYEGEITTYPTYVMQLPLIRHVAPLKKLVVNVHKAQTPEEVKRYLSEARDESLELD